MTTVAVASSAEHRKRLGQVFTGEPLARVLAALAQAAEARTIIDPMSGLGDMLVASSQGAARLDGLGLCLQLVNGSAFDPAAWAVLPDAWDLVITNPPYVRYQLGSAARPGAVAIPSADQVRKG